MSEQAPAWMASLPAELQGNATLSSFKGDKIEDVFPTLAKSYVEVRGLVGQREKKEDELFPKDDWKPEQYAAFNKRLGVPETPDKYPAVDAALLEKSGVDKVVIGEALKRFQELGLTPRQAKGLLHEWYLPTAVTGLEMQETQRKAASEKVTGDLKREFGDKYDGQVGLVKSVLALGGEDLANRLEAAGFGNDPQLFKALAKLGERILEDKSGRGGGGDLNPQADAARAQGRIKELMAARVSDVALNAKYQDPRSAEYREWQELHKKAYLAQS